MLPLLHLAPLKQRRALCVKLKVFASHSKKLLPASCFQRYAEVNGNLQTISDHRPHPQFWTPSLLAHARMLARFLPHPPFSSLPCSKAMAVSVLFLIRAQQVSFCRIRVKMGECRRSAQLSPQTDQNWRRLTSRNCSCTSGKSCNERRTPLETK